MQGGVVANFEVFGTVAHKVHTHPRLAHKYNAFSPIDHRRDTQLPIAWVY
jgi:hypothetical protein